MSDLYLKNLVCVLPIQKLYENPYEVDGKQNRIRTHFDWKRRSIAD